MKNLYRALLILLFAGLFVATSNNVYAQGCPSSEPYQLYTPDCKDKPVPSCEPCSTCPCAPVIHNNHIKIRIHVTKEFIKHRNWMIDEFFTKHILPAMAMMTTQLSTVTVKQVEIIGKFFDAKHQMETQRLFQKMMAEAHKDYQPSEGLCEIGTVTRSLAASSRKSDLGHVAFANRIMARQLLSKDVVSGGSEGSDMDSRIDMFVNNYCNKKDNADGLNYLCEGATAPKERINKDVDFSRTLESKLTIDAEFTKTEEEEEAEAQPDAEDVFALTANLFAHHPLPVISNRVLATEDGNPRVEAYRYLDLRSVAAKRSVAQNAFTAMVAERLKGDEESAQYLKRLVTELGVPDEDVEEILGETPSYFAQMEVLTKELYQNPTFYTELYDKPANVLRKGAAIRAINLMQDRDFYKSQLRSEAVLSVLLETMLNKEHNRVAGEIRDLKPGGEPAQ